MRDRGEWNNYSRIYEKETEEGEVFLNNFPSVVAGRQQVVLPAEVSSHKGHREIYGGCDLCSRSGVMDAGE